MSRSLFLSSATLMLLLSSSGSAITYTVDTAGDSGIATGGTSTSATSGDLRFILNTILNDQAQGTFASREITFAPAVTTVAFTRIPPMVNLFHADPVTIGNASGSPVTITSVGNNRAFFVKQGTVTLQNLVIDGAIAKGGNGSDRGGGGGMGAGGALFIDSAMVVLKNVTFTNNQAVGGTGAAGSGPVGAGGGLGGDGGSGGGSNNNGGGGYCGNGGVDFGGGGGAGGNGGIGGPGFGTGGGGGAIIGANGGLHGFNGGTVSNLNVSGGQFVFGGGGGGNTVGAGGNGGGTCISCTGNASGGGGGGGFNGTSSSGQNGADGGTGGGGGGGGFSTSAGGNGGPGGGGGGGLNGNGGYGGGGGARDGNGGFGGGGAGAGFGGFGGGGGGLGGGGFGGGSGAASFAPGGIGACNGDGASQGGGGAGLGGAIFINGPGTVVFEATTSVEMTNNSTIGGSGNGTGAAIGTDIFALSGAILTFVPSSNQTITLNGSIADDSIISLPGSPGGYNPGTSSGAGLTMNGPGKLVLNGNSTYIGPTTITGGRISVNGSMISDTTVTSGGTLGGIGFVGNGLRSANVTLQNGGIIAPGNSIGTLTITDTLTYAEGSITLIEIDPASASKIVVTGTAALNGTIQVNQDPGSYPASNSYLILSAGNRVGTFNPVVEGGLSGFKFGLDYVGNSVFLYYPALIQTTGLTGNALKLANYFNGSDFNFPFLVSLKGEELKDALGSISPARNAFGIFATQNTLFALDAMVSQHMSDYRLFQFPWCDAYCEECPPTMDVWLGAFGDFAHQKAEDQNPAFDFNTGGFIVGFDYYGNKDYGLLGGGIGFARTDLDDDHHGGGADINYYYGSLYGTLTFCDFYTEFAMWGVYHTINNTRNISFPCFHEKAKAHIHGWQIDPHLGVGYDFTFNWGAIEPFAAVDWAVNWESKFKEHGADGFNWRQKAHTSSMLRSEAGLKFYERWQFCWGDFFLRETFSYVNKKPFGTGKVRAAIVGASSFLTLESLDETMNLGSAGLELIFEPNGSIPTFTLSYDGEFGEDFRSQEVILKITKDF